MEPINILLVEDNPGDVLLMRSALKKARVANQVISAVNAEEALDVLYQRNGHEDAPLIDIALFDICLPGMSGIDLLHKVKSCAELKHVPVIMLTSSDAPDDIRNSYQEHANCYLTKPVDVSELMEMVRSLESFWFSIVRLPKHG
jgi:two-component system, chemotaxis family, response regulator Rcp1